MIMCSFHMPKFNLVESEKRVLEREREKEGREGCRPTTRT